MDGFLNQVIQCCLYSGTALLNQLREALSGSKRHRQNHKEFTESFDRNIWQNWNTMVENWQCNPKASNPFEEPITGRRPIISY